MKTFSLLLAAMALGAKLTADETNAPASARIGTSDASKYYEQVMIVTGRVAEVTIRPTVTFLNLDKPYPNSPFTIVVFHGHSSFYADANVLKGRSVEIKGRIKNYHDQPEIALDNTNQLTVYDSNGQILVIPGPKQTNASPAAASPPTNTPAVSSSTNLSEIL